MKMEGVPELRKSGSVIRGMQRQVGGDTLPKAPGEPGSTDTWALAQRTDFRLLSFCTAKEDMCYCVKAYQVCESCGTCVDVKS